MKYFVFLLVFCNILNGQNYTFKNKTFYLEKVKNYTYKDENNKEIKFKNNFFIKIKRNIKNIINIYNITLVKTYSLMLR
jgi:hypothetical protein